jgi:predicted branched-subunit amino acid permease
MRGTSRSDWRTYLAAHLANDEATAFGRAGRTDREKWSRFTISAILLFIAWVGGAALGQLLGTVLDAQMLGLDTALPILLFCLVVGDMRNRFLGITAAAGAVLALALTPIAPLGLASVVALLALLPAAGVLRLRQSRAASSDAAGTAGADAVASGPDAKTAGQDAVAEWHEPAPGSGFTGTTGAED